MDNIDTLMSKVSISKEKSKKEENGANNNISNSLLTNNSTLASTPDSFESYYQNIMSPKSPVFKPQQTPNDMLTEMLLPVSEIASDSDEDQEDKIKEIETFMKKPRKYSLPVNPTLNIWVGTGSKNTYNFEMIEESEADMFNLDDSPANRRQGTKEGKAPSPRKRLGDNIDSLIDIKRTRSQSENITSCTIFKFMETTSKVTGKRKL
mmetsp:Transcript_10547/g.12066  ORF Transcript_10547/g.12066 Transcript_10547/m.12066 type:complete len:207 (+) Transcript_10547:84-704(+)